MNMKILALQIDVSTSKEENLKKVEEELSSIDTENIDIVILPEMFICPYQSNLFEQSSGNY